MTLEFLGDEDVAPESVHLLESIFLPLTSTVQDSMIGIFCDIYRVLFPSCLRRSAAGVVMSPTCGRRSEVGILGTGSVGLTARRNAVTLQSEVVQRILSRMLLQLQKNHGLHLLSPITH